MNDYAIDAHWDAEAQVWVATSDDLPGLVTEADTVEALLIKLRVIIPELLECSGSSVTADIPFSLHTRRHDVAHAA